jgi:hypothetical protein
VACAVAVGGTTAVGSAAIWSAVTTRTLPAMPVPPAAPWKAQ